MIDTQSASPLYKQVKDDILLKIQNDHFETGKIPSEKELVSLYNVSIITIRRAISELVDDNVLQKKQGKGTFILRKPFLRSFTQSVSSFTEICVANGMKASAKLLRGDIEYNPSPSILSKLNLSEGSKVVYIERLRYADNYPVVIETTCFPIKYAFLLDEDLEHKSMYALLHENNRDIVITVKPGTRVIKIVHANTNTAKLLQISRGAPVLTLDGLCYNGTTDEPLHTTYHIGYSEHLDFSVYV